MDRISNSDRLLAILRQRLRERADVSARRVEANRAGARDVDAADGLRALSVMDGADQRQLRRAGVQALLVDQIGGTLLNDAQFQQIVTRVTDAISEDPVTARLLDGVVAIARSR